MAVEVSWCVSCITAGDGNFPFKAGPGCQGRARSRHGATVDTRGPGQPAVAGGGCSVAASACPRAGASAAPASGLPKIKFNYFDEKFLSWLSRNRNPYLKIRTESNLVLPCVKSTVLDCLLLTLKCTSSCHVGCRMPKRALDFPYRLPCAHHCSKHPKQHNHNVSD